MRAVEHNPEFAAEVEVPQKVGKDFSDADKAAGVSYGNLPARRGPQRQASAKRKARVAK